MSTKGKVVVTGGAGFVGSHLVGRLLQKGYDVQVVDTFVNGKQEERLHADAKYHAVDVRDTEKLKEIFTNAVQIYHLAALVSVEESLQKPEEYMAVNAGGALSVLETMRQIAPAARLVYISSAAVYGDQTLVPTPENVAVHPMSPYALAKHAAEEYCAVWNKTHGTHVVIIRPFNIYGPRMSEEGSYASAIGRFMKMRKEGKPLLMFGDGKQRRDYVHVRDLVDAYVRAGVSDQVGNAEILNIGSGKSVEMNTVAAFIGGDVFYQPPRIEIRNSQGDITRARDLLSWEPQVSLEEGIIELKKLAHI